MGTTDLPRTVELRDGKEITLSLVQSSDREGLLTFFKGLPDADRLVLKDNVTTDDWADRFLRKIAAKEIISLIAKEGDRIIAEGSLYRTLHGWMRHIGEIRLTVQPSRRRAGLGFIMAETLTKMAMDAGIEKIIIQVVESQMGAFRTFEKLGFHREAVLPRHVMDLSGRKRDLIIMANDVSQIWAAMEALVQDYHLHAE